MSHELWTRALAVVPIVVSALSLRGKWEWGRVNLFWIMHHAEKLTFVVIVRKLDGQAKVVGLVSPVLPVADSLSDWALGKT